jgi:hypothetical protein
MRSVVIDTNVPIVANGRNTHASVMCRLACVEFLLEVVEEGRVALDTEGRVFDQYRRYLNFSGEPGVGDAFFKHVFDNMYVEARVERIALHRVADECRQFEEFPADPDLAQFDRSDVVLVALALAVRPRPRPIVNATDGGWQRFHEALRRHGVRVVELCKEPEARR